MRCQRGNVLANAKYAGTEPGTAVRLAVWCLISQNPEKEQGNSVANQTHGQEQNWVTGHPHIHWGSWRTSAQENPRIAKRYSLKDMPGGLERNSWKWGSSCWFQQPWMRGAWNEVRRKGLQLSSCWDACSWPARPSFQDGPTLRSFLRWNQTGQDRNKDIEEKVSQRKHRQEISTSRLSYIWTPHEHSRRESFVNLEHTRF